MWTYDPEKTPTTAEEMQPIVVKAFGYTDLVGKLQASYILGTAQRTVFNEAVSEIRKAHGKEIKAAAEKLSKWGAPLSEKAVFDVIAKVLIANQFYPFPAVVAALAEPLMKSMNPFQSRHILPDARGDQVGYQLDRT